MSRSRFRLFLKALVPALALLALGDPAHAAPPWAPFGPGGGSVMSLAVDPRDADVVYAVARVASWTGTLYGSTDGGATWRALVGQRIFRVAIDPGHPSVLYAAGSQQVLRSADGGLTWNDVSPPIGPLGGAGELTVGSDGTVFVVSLADDSRLWRSADGGRSWATVAVERFGKLAAVTVDPTDPRRVYYGADRKVRKSTDGGLHWADAGQPAASSSLPLVKALAVVPSAPSSLFLVGFGGSQIYRSDDGAATWRVVGTLPGNAGTEPALVLVDPRSPDRLYATSEAGGIFASLDGGRTWTQRDDGLRVGFRGLAATSLAFSPSQPDRLYTGLYAWGVARSDDGGSHWRGGAEPGLSAGLVQLLRIDPRAPDTVYLGLDYDGSRSFRSTDGGQSWLPFAPEIAWNGLWDLAFDPRQEQVLYAAAGGGLWKSADGGGSWDLLHAGLATQVAVAARQVLVASFDCGLHRSVDGGRTWKRVLFCSVDDEDEFYVRSLWVEPGRRRDLYALGVITNQSGAHFAYGAYRSQDAGATWKKLPAGLCGLAVAPSDSRVLYGSDCDGRRLLRSGDGGRRWAVANPGRLPPLYPGGPLAVDPADPETVYLGTWTGALVSHDGGRTFSPAAPPFEVDKKAVARLWTAPGQPGTVYAAAVEGGLFVGRFE